MDENINAKELEMQKKAQERVTQPLHPEDITSFLRDSSEDHTVTVQEKEKQRIVRTIAPTPA